MEILIFEEETKAGLSEIIGKSTSVFNYSEAKANKTVINLEHFTKASNLSLPDLYPMTAILASTGLNKNDDFFDNEETFAAKDTPVNKPFNFDHQSSDIIGHILSSSIATFDGKNYTGNSAPESFDIPFNAVLYRHFHDDLNKQERTNKIIAALENPNDNDKWFVSMECRFRGFDYLMAEENNIASAKIIERNNNTAFLTKHLRAYGGTGVYKDHKLGRFLRNITFSAVGLVRKPGNERSIILSPSLGTTSGKLYTFSETLEYTNNSEVQMNEVEKLKADLAKANEIIATAEKTNWEKKFKDMEVAMDDLKKHLSKEKDDKAKADKEKDEEKSAKAAAVAEVEIAKSALKTLEASNKELQDQLNQFKTEAAKAEADRKNLARINKVKEVYAVANDEEAKKIADPLAALTDEAFSAHLDVIKAFKLKEVKIDTQKVNPADTAKAALDNAKKVDEPALNVGNTQNDEGKALASELSEFFNLGKDVEDQDSPKKKKNKNKK